MSFGSSLASKRGIPPMLDDPPEPRVTDPNGTYVDRLTMAYRVIDDPVSDKDIGPSRVRVVDPHGRRPVLLLST
jgi:hypothetical protein